MEEVLPLHAYPEAPKGATLDTYDLAKVYLNNRPGCIPQSYQDNGEIDGNRM